MIGPLTDCVVSICDKKASTAIVFTLPEIPITLESQIPVTLDIPVCGQHIGLFSKDWVKFMQSMDSALADARAKAIQALEKENVEALTEPDSDRNPVPVYGDSGSPEVAGSADETR